jgi:hypothetical protein
MSALTEQQAAVIDACHRFTLALGLHLAAPTHETARELVDASNALDAARLAATLAALKATHPDVLARSLARAARCS